MQHQIMGFNIQPVLADNLVTLTPLKATDFDRLYAVASDPLIWEMHPAKDRYRRDVFQKFFDVALQSGGAFVVLDTATGEVIGSTRFYDLNVEESRIAIGYTFLARKYWGGKHNFAMKKHMLDYAFSHVSSVLFHVGVDNIRSQRAVMKLGAKKLREVGFDMAGKMMPHIEYVITIDDWKTFSAR